MNPSRARSRNPLRRQPRVGFLTQARLLTLLVMLGAAPVCFGQTEEATEATQIGALELVYIEKDPHYLATMARLPGIRSALDDLKGRVAAARSADPAQLAACEGAVSDAERRAAQAARSKGFGPGGVADLLSDGPADPSELTKVTTACTADLRAVSGDTSAIAAAVARLDGLRREARDEYEQIDAAGARRKAEDAARRTIEAAVCERIDFQEEGYTVRSSRVENPFAFLPWVRAARRKAESEIAALVDNKPFRYETASSKALEIVEKSFNSESIDARLLIRVEVVSVENCANRKLDLVYRIYSTQIRPVLSGAPESRKTEKEAPQETAGQTRVENPAASPLHLTPKGGYDFTNKAFGGGRLEITSKNFWKLPFNVAVIEGEGSSSMRSLSASVGGSTESEGWLAHAEWLLNYANYSLPTGAGEFQGGQLSGHFSGTTRAFAGGNVSLRFGALLEGGNRQSDLRGLPLAPRTVANAGFGSFKAYAGLYSRLPHHILSASYGFELGAVGRAARADWRKHVGDFRHEFWRAVGDHRILSLESRLTAGTIQVPGRIPLSERFFGGANEQLFIPGESWEIRANPVIRAIPASSFYRTAEGAGGRRFVSYNLTAAYAVWRKALVPSELTSDEEFTSEVEGAINTVTSTLQNFYTSVDPNFTKVVTRLPEAKAALEDLKQKVLDSQAARPGEFPAEYTACTRAVNTALRRVNSAIDPQGGIQYGLVADLLSDDPDNALLKVAAACGRDLTAAVGDPAIAAASASVGRLRDSLLADFNRVDQQAARAKAEAEMAFTRRTLKTLFNEVNIYSVSPVFVFDAAKLGPAGPGFGGVRYGPGGGVRFELATIANFTVGYARNVRRAPGEGRGNLFFSISVRDLFH